MGIKKPDDSHYGKFAAFGAAQGYALRLSGRLMREGNFFKLRHSKGVLAANFVASTAAGAASAVDAIKHGKREGSVLSGIGRWLANNFSMAGGQFIGGMAGQVTLNLASNAKYHTGKWRAARDAAAKVAERANGKTVKGTVVGKNGKSLRFVRIRGRVVPIRTEVR